MIAIRHNATPLRSHHSSDTDKPRSSAEILIDAQIGLLRQLAALVSRVSDNHFTLRPVGVIEGSIGAHVRHCLDHVGALLDAADSGRLDYDRRARGVPDETDRAASVERIELLVGRLKLWRGEGADRSIEFAVLATADGGAARVTSTLGREIAYSLSHTIHHQAIIAAMVRTLGMEVPAGFGVAPSTLMHRRSVTCAR